MTLLAISFLAGILTVLSPCVLPLLPIIVGGSLAGGTSFRRALTVTLSLGISVFLFTFLLKVSTAFINVPPEFWNWLSGGILFLIGILFLFPHLWDLVPGTAKANQRSTALMSSGFMRQNFWGDVLVGAALGPVFSTCSPTYFVVLASVLPVSVAAGATDIFAYILGLCLFLLAIAFVGQRILDRLVVTANGSGWFKRIVGVLFLVVGFLIVTNLSAAVEAPLYSIFDETKIEQYLLQKNMSVPTGATTTPSLTDPASILTVPGITIPKSAPASFLTSAEKMIQYQKAPELVSPDGYLNTGGQPISIAQYRGKDVVLVDFWTYSCINCQRTLPYLTTWYSKYKDQGLVIIGVHTPEFAFEHLQSNVADALKRFDITYPVVLDNEYKTWNAFGNQFWPHEYLIDIDGYVVHDHTGEGDYDQTEAAIQAALAERAERLGTAMPDDTVVAATIPEADLSGVESPETYFGAARNEYLANGTQGTVGAQTLTAPKSPAPNALYLVGDWNFAQEYATNQSAGAQVIYNYSSKNVYFVASGEAAGTQIEVLQDGAPVGANAGADVVNGVVTITGSRLYHLVSNPSAGAHILKLIIKSPGLQAYTFTFG